MTPPNQSNPIVRLLQGMQKLLTDIMPALSLKETPIPIPKERAVRVWEIMNYVQKELDAAGTVNEYGDVMSSGYVLDVYIDDTGTFAICTHSDGKLYKVPVFVDDQSQITTGEEVEVYMEFTPVSRNLKVQREVDADGNETGVVRWFAMPACTAILNRSGEIDSRALFDTFVEYAERSNDYPELDFWHLGERLVFGKADMLFHDDVNFCASGVFYDSPIARAVIESLENQGDYWGLSIAYLPTKEPEKIRSAEGVEIPVYNDGICRYISLLPEDSAASILTSITTQEEVNRMNAKQLEALKVITGGENDLYKSIVDQLNETNRSAAKPGVVTRAAATPVAKAKGTTPVVVTPAKPAPAAAKPVTRELSEDDLKAIFGSAAFTDAVNSIFEARAAQAAAAEGEETEDSTPEAPVAEEERSTKDLLVELIGKVDAVSKSRDAEIQEVLDDLPAKIAKARIVRPRATMLPDALVTTDRKNIDLAAVANRTLEKMGAAE